ncbi:DUF695 domain-containing protein [candidate division KSB1 bacterium]|nr:DUF695 domain-containing protein [candidate division KSB1 bacterium]
MSDISKWDFYQFEAEGKPVSVMLDMALINLAPLPDRPILVWFRLKLQQTGEDGLAVREEVERLYELETDIEQELTGPFAAVFAGKITTGGFRDLYFYAEHEYGVTEVLEKLKSSYPEYQLSGGVKKDTDWAVYREIIYPSRPELYTIMNRRILNQLKKHGDKHTKPRKVDHWIGFETEADRKNFIAKVIEKGFIIESKETMPDNKPNPLKVRISRIDNVNEVYINRLVLNLMELAEENNGEYDGWETMVMKE